MSEVVQLSDQLTEFKFIRITLQNDDTNSLIVLANFCEQNDLDIMNPPDQIVFEFDSTRTAEEHEEDIVIPITVFLCDSSLSKIETIDEYYAMKEIDQSELKNYIQLIQNAESMVDTTKEGCIGKNITVSDRTVNIPIDIGNEIPLEIEMTLPNIQSIDSCPVMKFIDSVGQGRIENLSGNYIRLTKEGGLGSDTLIGEYSLMYEGYEAKSLFMNTFPKIYKGRYNI